MNIARTFSTSRFVMIALMALTAGAFTLPVDAQTAGNNAVYKSTGTTGSSAITGSNSSIDLTVVTTTGDICARINSILSGTSTAGAFKGGTVIDARGFGSGTSQLCTTNPFAGITTPSAVLLPSGIITISQTWSVPDQTRVLGLGRDQTTLKAGASFTSPMIQMGNNSCGGAMPSGICFEVIVAHLTLDGVGENIDGVDNLNSEEQSTVDDVAILHTEGTALFLGTAATLSGTSAHSGPYTNIFVQANGTGVTTRSTTACVKITDSGTQPRGIHGITCIADGTPSGAIYLDGNNVSIEDVTIDGFTDGIVIGAEGASNTVQTNVIFNVTGADANGTVSNLVHLCGSGSSSPCPATFTNTIQNITIMGLSSIQGDTLRDDFSGTTLQNSTDAFVGLYALGQPVGGGFSRFSTSPRTPTWGVGSLSSSITSTACTGSTTPASANGSLFSNTNTSVAGTLFACVSGLWKAVP